MFKLAVAISMRLSDYGKVENTHTHTHRAPVNARLITKTDDRKKERKKEQRRAAEVCVRMREELTLPGRHHVVDVNSRPNLARLYAGNVSETKRITTASRQAHLRDARTS